MNSMKLLLIICLSAWTSQWAHAHRYLGCGVGMHHQQWHGLDNRLRAGEERYALVQCQLDNNPLPDRRQWFFALPNAQWQYSPPSQISRSGWDAHHQAINLELPFFRAHAQAPYWHIIWQEQRTEFRDELTAGLRLRADINPHSLPQDVQVQQTQRDLGIGIDLRHWPIHVNHVQLRYRQQHQPVAYQWLVNDDQQRWFGNSQRQLWVLQMGHNSEGIGWRWPWHLSLGQGYQRVDQRPLTSNNVDARIAHQQITLQLGADYRHRFTRQWHGRFQANAQAEYGRYDRVTNGVQMRDDVSYQVTVLLSLEWRR